MPARRLRAALTVSSPACACSWARYPTLAVGGSTRTSPAVGTSRPARICKRVDLPTPFGPTTPRQVRGPDGERHVARARRDPPARGAGDGRPGSRAVRRRKQAWGAPGSTGIAVGVTCRNVLRLPDASCSTSRRHVSLRTPSPRDRGARRIVAGVVGSAREWLGRARSRSDVRRAAERLNEATGSQPPCDAAVSGRAVRCTQGRRWGTGRGGSSAGERPGRRDLRCTDDRRRPCTSGPAGDSARRRIPQRAIEIVGIVLGIGLVATVARSTALSNDEFWSLAAGQWMLGHHSFMGLDPFSYTESHRRWVTDEWGSEIALAEMYRVFGNAAYSLYAIVLGGLCLVATRGLRAGARGAGRPGCRHRHPARPRHRRDRGERPWARLLPGVVPARTPDPDQGAARSALAAPSAAALPALGQHPWVDTPRTPRRRGRVGMVACPGTVRARDRRRAPVAVHRLVGSRACWGASSPRVSRRTGRASWPTTSTSPGTARFRGTSPSGTHRISIPS